MRHAIVTTTAEGSLSPLGGNAPPHVNLAGRLVALGPQRRDLAPKVQRWLNDLTVSAPLGRDLFPLTAEAAEALYTGSEGAADQIWFTLYERATLRPIGITGLRDIDHQHGTAEFVIFIGEKDGWGRGYGTETAVLMLEYGFSALGLRNIMLRVYDFNVRGMRAYLRAGFHEIGRQRRAQRLGDRIADVILMDCPAGGFQSRGSHDLRGEGGSRT
jgi:RimJ/RimL family protein N-acetyltransferase